MVFSRMLVGVFKPEKNSGVPDCLYEKIGYFENRSSDLSECKTKVCPTVEDGSKQKLAFRYLFSQF